MRLKKIKISGFKSFADKVTLDFHEGITIVVGPNGCGKSNIADAFRWVMGEQSVKSMRGGKMQDVIFAGSSLRKPLGMAEVSLTFVNNEGRVHVPYHEVEITRRYHRDGESEYLINGNNVRLKDVQSILMDVGIGKNAYAIIEQGKIDQIIQLGPNERRVIFEEAAGILKFLINKRETERKLSEVELNCSRLKDIHDEVQKEIDHLSGQAMKANEYKSLKAKGEAFERDYLSLKIDQLSDKKAKLEADKHKLQEQNQKEDQTLREKRESLRRSRETLEKEALILRDKEKTLYELKASIEVKEKEQESLQERLKEGEKAEAKILAEQEALEAEKKLRSEDQKAYEIRQKELSKNLEKETQKLKEKESQLLKAEEKATLTRKELENVQERLLELTRESHAVSSEMKQKSVRYETLLEKGIQLEKEASRLKEALKAVEKEAEVKKKELDLASNQVDQAKERFEALELTIRENRSSLEGVEAVYETLSHELLGLQAKEKALLKLKEEMEGAQEGTKALLKEAKRKGSKLFNKLKGLWEFFEIESGYEAAVDAVLRPYSDTLVAETESDYKEALAFAETSKLLGYSLVWVSEKEKKAVENTLYSKVKKGAVQHHFLKDKYLAKDKEELLKADKETFSLDGFFKDRSGVVFSPSKKSQSLFLREAELKKLSEKIQKLEKEAGLKKSELETLRNARQSLNEERMEKDKAIRALEMGLVDKNYKLKKALSEEERLQAHLKVSKEEREKGLQEQKLLERELSSLDKKNQAEESALKAIANEKEALFLRLQKEEAAFKHESAVFKEEKNAFNIKADESRKILYALNLIEVKDQEGQAKETKLKRELEEIKEQAVFLNAKFKDLASLSRDHGGDLGVLETQKTEFEKALQAKKEEIKAKEEELLKADEAAKEKLLKAQSLEGKFIEVSTQLQGVVEEFQDKWEGFEPKAPDLPLAQVEAEVKRIKKALEGYQDINLAAAETLDQHKTRASSLEQEIGDLLSSKEELEAIIHNLSNQSMTLFKETFDSVRANFKKNFSILFQGGEADLELTDSEDLLKAGIEIVAKPPGKQMRSINLLSGGEKCLTAMALLFSLFEVKAAPFCLLDEIDAPLDDTNVGRFSEMVKHFVERSQFIIITHNKRTMSMGDRLFGVSMEEKGVSKLLRVEFEKEAKHAPKEVALV